jgi:tellurite resistance protein TerC
MREALKWSLFWVAISLLFNLGLYVWKGTEPALAFLTGYLIEKSLSVDNIFVFLVIFTSLKIPQKNQHKILYYGILGAMILRAFFILSGSALLEKFYLTTYIFGGILVVTGIKLITRKEGAYDPKKSRILPMLTRRIPLKMDYEGNHFFVRENGIRYATPLFAALVLVESADIVFAVDSIPAILAVTPDPFIVYTSNVFAILGLRSLYFVFSSAATELKYLNYGLAIILVFIGVKMMLEHYFPISTSVSLGVVGGVLSLTVLMSLRANRASKAKD